MTVSCGSGKYEVVLANQYCLRDLLESITLTDSLSSIAYKAEIKIPITSDFPGIENGQQCRISGIPFGSNYMTYLLYPGVVWEIDSITKGVKHLIATVYDTTIYLEKSEDEYLFPDGQTASQRIKQYAADWGFGIDSSNFPDTKVLLAKTGTGSSHRGYIYDMIMADLKESVSKGGAMYRPRITLNGLELFHIGGNSTVWVLESLESIEQNRTLEGAVTRVKVLGQETEGQRTPVLAIVSGDTAQYGTLQKILQDEKITSAAEGKTKGQAMLTGVQQTITVIGPDINTMRAGDLTALNGMELIVTDISHELGTPGHMTAQLASVDYVRRKYYTDES